ncbi:discoidin domain-containing protein [Eubacteriales bacterium OttesenSCG-928-A19]|nr:discoidin domain-containing protein [Eubacteriales bacterium OttesenSCG-928-A19]
MYRIEVRNKQGELLAASEGHGDARLVYEGTYAPGDRIVFAAPQAHVSVALERMTPGMLYLPKEGFSFGIPFGDARNGYEPGAFEGTLHAISIAPLPEDARSQRRNIACNPLDQHEESGAYPHAVANVETRGEAQFWARNAIDGHRFNDRHGPWPYHSWGIGERKDAWLRVDFGRPVTVDEVAIILRADFPHDAWWEAGTIEGSDGFSTRISLAKTGEAQYFPIGRHTVTWLRLGELVKADDPSPFPALTQLEVYGHDAG